MSINTSGMSALHMFGYNVGDRVRLGDTNLIVEVEKDLTSEGNQSKFGGGKVVRDGMGQDPRSSSKSGSPDLVITNALIIDYTGIYKADIGIKDGIIIAIGNSGNPGVVSDIDPRLVISASTEVISAEGKIITAGGVDSHIHFICPQQINTAFTSGITTMIGGGTGPATGTLATTCTPGPWNIHRMYESIDDFPLNFGFLGKGNSSLPHALYEQIHAGACGLKLHEDWGTTPAAIDSCLTVADKTGVQVAIHTDTLNESGYVEDTIKAIGGRTIHTYHSEGAGGGHAPDIIKVCSYPNILPSSTNPTLPTTINTVAEHRDMLMVCHHLDNRIPEDIAFADSRIRQQTMCAEDYLHDIGAISIVASDSQAMGRVGETITRTWQVAHVNKQYFGSLKEDSANNDNERIKRYIAKYTINPAIAHGIHDYVGSIEVGKAADLCLWNASFFGVYPDIVIKQGLIAQAGMGDANGSIATTQPYFSRPMFGSFGRRAAKSSMHFISQQGLEYHGEFFENHLHGNVMPIKDVRTLKKTDMKLNDALPKIEVNPENYEVRINGNVIDIPPSEALPLTQRYFLF